MKLPQVKLRDKSISRLILGSNPISGFSHLSAEKDREMVDYHTTQNVKRLFDECLANGINTFQARGDRHIMRVLNEYWNERGNIQWIAQTASEVRDFRANIESIAKNKAIAIYHHGTYVDNLWHAGRISEIEDTLKIIRSTGLPVGLGTHMPEVIRHAEDNSWDVDFYMTSFYNLAKQAKHMQATEGFKEETFDDSDSEAMISQIRRTSKPCLAFKVLGAGRKTSSRKELTRAFSYAFKNIKPIDAVVVGMFQKYKNEVRENAGIVRQILSGS